MGCRAVVRYLGPQELRLRNGPAVLIVARLTGGYSFKRRPWRGRSMTDHNSRRNWVTVGALALLHAGTLAAFFLFTWQALWIALALLWISGGWGIGMGYHRLLTHRGYETPRWLELTLTICGTLALQGGPIFWVATHRLHHRNSDKSGDPHSPRDGWWWSHAGWAGARRSHARGGTRTQRRPTFALHRTDLTTRGNVRSRRLVLVLNTRIRAEASASADNN